MNTKRAAAEATHERHYEAVKTAHRARLEDATYRKNMGFPEAMPPEALDILAHARAMSVVLPRAIHVARTKIEPIAIPTIAPVIDHVPSPESVIDTVRRAQLEAGTHKARLQMEHAFTTLMTPLFAVLTDALSLQLDTKNKEDVGSLNALPES